MLVIEIKCFDKTSNGRSQSFHTSKSEALKRKFNTRNGGVCGLQEMRLIEIIKRVLW
jgi:hypothetical protein